MEEIDAYQPSDCHESLSSSFFAGNFKVPASKDRHGSHGALICHSSIRISYKDRFGVRGRPSCSRWSAFSKQGNENVISSLAADLAKHKNVVYLVAGATISHSRARRSLSILLAGLGEEIGVESN